MTILSKLHRFNVILHQIDSDVDGIHVFDEEDPKTNTVHLGYHRVKYYTSVRDKSETKKARSGPSFHNKFKLRMDPTCAQAPVLEHPTDVPEEIKVEEPNDTILTFPSVFACTLLGLRD